MSNITLRKSKAKTLYRFWCPRYDAWMTTVIDVYAYDEKQARKICRRWIAKKFSFSNLNSYLRYKNVRVKPYSDFKIWIDEAASIGENVWTKFEPTFVGARGISLPTNEQLIIYDETNGEKL